MSNIIVGAYSKFSELSKEDREVFDSVLDKLGVHYNPLLVSTQVVEGTNYMFVCNFKTVVLESVYKPCLVIIHQDLDGNAYLSAKTLLPGNI